MKELLARLLFMHLPPSGFQLTPGPLILLFMGTISSVYIVAEGHSKVDYIVILL